MSLNTDQRGRSLPFTNAVPPAISGDHSDIGAVEVQPDDLPSAIPPSLVSWWRAENNLLDSAGTNHGAPDSAVTYETGKVGIAFQPIIFGGGGVRIPASTTLDVGRGAGFSIESWVKADDTTNPYPLVEWHNGAEFGAHVWANVTFAGGTQGSVYVSLDHTVPHILATPAVLQPSVWHHIVVTYDKNSGEVIYVDGVARAQAAYLGVASITSYDLHFGRRPGADILYGSIDEVSLYNRALSAADVALLHERSSLGKELPRLRIVNSPSDSVSLYWQLAYSNYGPDSRSNLTTATWLPIPLSRTQAGAEWQVVAPRQATQKFFRLTKP